MLLCEAQGWEVSHFRAAADPRKAGQVLQHSLISQLLITNTLSLGSRAGGEQLLFAERQLRALQEEPRTQRSQQSPNQRQSPSEAAEPLRWPLK